MGESFNVVDRVRTPIQSTVRWCETFLSFIGGFFSDLFYLFLVVRPSRSLFSPPRLSWKINQTSNIEINKKVISTSTLMTIHQRKTWFSVKIDSPH